MAVRIQIRRDASTSWQSVNPVLAEGELGYETDTGRLKIGDGSTAWNDLPYFTGAGGAPGGFVGSVQYKVDDSTFGGDSYFKYDHDNIQLVIDDTSASGINTTIPTLYIKSQKGIALRVEREGSARIDIKCVGSDPFSAAALHLEGIDGAFGTVSYMGSSLRMGTSPTAGFVTIENLLYVTKSKIGLGGTLPEFRVHFKSNASGQAVVFEGEGFNFLIGETISSSEDINALFGVFQTLSRIHINDKTQIKAITAPSDNPDSGYGFLYHDSADSHLKWKLSDGTVFDLCEGTGGGAPGGEQYDIQYKVDDSTFGGSSAFKIIPSTFPYMNFYELRPVASSNSGMLRIQSDVDASGDASGNFDYAFSIGRNTNFGGNITQLVGAARLGISFDGDATTLSEGVTLDLSGGISSTSSSFTVSDLSILTIQPVLKSGTIDTIRGLYLKSVDFGTGGGSYSALYGIYQEDANATNIFEGYTKFGNDVEVDGDIIQTKTDAENQFYWINRFGKTGDGGYIYVYGGIYVNDISSGNTRLYLDGLTGFIKFYPSVSASSIGTVTTPILFVDQDDYHIKYKYQDTLWDLTEKYTPGTPENSFQYNQSGAFAGSPIMFHEVEAGRSQVKITQSDRTYGSDHGLLYIDGTFVPTEDVTGYVDVRGASIFSKVNSDYTLSGYFDGLQLYTQFTGSGSANTMRALHILGGMYDTTSTGSIGSYTSLHVDVGANGGTGSSIDTITQVYLGSVLGNKYNKLYGIYQDDSNAVNVFKGKISIGTEDSKGNLYILKPSGITIFEGDDFDFTIGQSGVTGVNDYVNTYFGFWASEQKFYTRFPIFIHEIEGPTPETPTGRMGNLFHDQADGHLKWLLPDGTLYDLCEVASPQGPDEAIQFNDNGSFAGLPNFAIDNDFTPPIMFVRNSDGVLPTHSGILQVINNVTIDSEITDPTYSRTASVIRRDTLNADASGGRFTNFWIQNFTYGSGGLYNQYNMVCNFGIYDNASSVSITNSYGIQITPYVKSGSITNLYGIRINSYVSGGSVVNFYPIYQDGNVGKNVFEASVGIGDYTLFDEKLYVQGNVWVRGDDSYIIHTSDEYVTDQTDSNIYFGVKAGDGYILQGLDFVKWSEVPDASYIPTPESGFGALYAYNKDLYWKDSDGNIWRLTTFREGQFEDRGFVYSIYDGATSRYILKSDSAVQYNNGIDFSNADHFLSGSAISVLPFELSTNQNYAEYRFINNYNGTDRRFSFWIMTEDAPENPNTIFFDGTLDLRMDFPGATIIGGGAFLKMKNSKFMFTDVDNPMQTDDTGVWVYSTAPNLKLEHRGGNSVSLKLKTGSAEWTFKNNIDASNALSVIYNTSEYIRIATNGNVLIGGGENPKYNLHVLGEVKYDYSFCGKLTFTVPANTGKWVRIAQSGPSAGRNFGLFRITYQVSGYHGHKVFYVAADFNKEDYFNVNLIGGGRYNSDAIHRIRILSDDSDTYAVMYIEVYVQNYNSSSIMTVEVEQDFKSDDGWELLPIAEDGSTPTGYTEYIYELSERAFSVNVYKHPLLDVSERTVRMGGSDRHDINYALSVKGTSEFYSVNQAPNDDVVLQVENNMRVYGTSDGTDWFTYQFYDTSTDEIEALVALYNGTSPPTLRLVSRGDIQFAAGQSDVWDDSPTNPATLYSDGTFRAKYFRPTSGYRAVDGSNGISTTITCTDTEIGVRYTLTFKNGLLVAVSSSTFT